eukprot:3375935-Rhodomonas_salina.7
MLRTDISYAATLACYSRAMRCPVLTSRMLLGHVSPVQRRANTPRAKTSRQHWYKNIRVVLRICYGMSGTETG